MSGKTLKVDTSKLRRDLKNLGKAAQKSADGAVRVAVQQAGAFYMQFDEVDALPFVKDSNGKITLVGKQLAAEAESEEEVLAIQTQVAAQTMQSLVQRGVKEAVE